MTKCPRFASDAAVASGASQRRRRTGGEVTAMAAYRQPVRPLVTVEEVLR
jgi:hypothetical protein